MSLASFLIHKTKNFWYFFSFLTNFRTTLQSSEKFDKKDSWFFHHTRRFIISFSWSNVYTKITWEMYRWWWWWSFFYEINVEIFKYTHFFDFFFLFLSLPKSYVKNQYSKQLSSSLRRNELKFFFFSFSFF